MASPLKTLIAAGCLAAYSLPANAAIFIEYEGIMHTFDNKKYERMKVCDFKKVVAKKLGLRPAEFILMARGKALQGDITFTGLELTGDFRLNIRKAKNAKQCNWGGAQEKW